MSPPTIGAVERVGGDLHAEVELLGVVDRAHLRQRDGRDGGGGEARHRGAIGQVAVHDLAPDVARRVDVGIEVHAVEHLVDADDEQVVAGPLEDGQVVARRDEDVLVRAAVCLRDPVDEVELAGHEKAHTVPP